MMASMPLCLFGECHAPYVGCGVGISTLRYEVDVFAIVAPYGAEVVGGMVGRLAQVGPVDAACIYVGVVVGDTLALHYR